jgi:hypothetical protein
MTRDTIIEKLREALKVAQALTQPVVDRRRQLDLHDARAINNAATKALSETETSK